MVQTANDETPTIVESQVDYVKQEDEWLYLFALDYPRLHQTRQPIYIAKRYKEFRRLYEELSKWSSRIASFAFPSRTLFQPSQEVKKERQDKLQQFLRLVLEEPLEAGGLVAMTRFLQANNTAYTNPDELACQVYLSTAQNVVDTNKDLAYANEQFDKVKKQRTPPAELEAHRQATATAINDTTTIMPELKKNTAALQEATRQHNEILELVKKLREDEERVIQLEAMATTKKIDKDKHNTQLEQDRRDLATETRHTEVEQAKLPSLDTSIKELESKVEGLKQQKTGIEKSLATSNAYIATSQSEEMKITAKIKDMEKLQMKLDQLEKDLRTRDGQLDAREKALPPRAS